MIRRHKATQAAPLSTSDGARLPFYVSWIGSFLGSSLNPAQLDAFAAQYLPTPTAGAEAATKAASVASASDSTSDVAAALRERDAAEAKVATLEAASAELHSRVTAMQEKMAAASADGVAEMTSLRAKLKEAESDAADTRIALNALKEQSKIDVAAAVNDAGAVSKEEVERMVATGERRAAAEAFANAKAAADAAARNAEDVKARAIAEVRAQSREELDELVKSSQAAIAAAMSRAEAAEAEAAAAAAAAASASTESMAVTATTVTHPTYGTLLHDFGYKKVYAMPAAHLVSKEKVAVYEQQRAFRAERAEVIAKEKAKEVSFSIPGVISLAEGTAPVKKSSKTSSKISSKTKSSKTDNKAATGGVTAVSILDGQHRVGALDILLEKSIITAEDRVLVEVFPDVDDKKAVDLFMEINQAQPIRFVDLPGVTTPDVKWMLEGAVQRLKETYPTMFSDSARCKMPNVNLDNLREELFSAEIHARFNITTEEDFAAWLNGVNARLAARSDDDWLASRPKRGRGAGGSKATYLKALGKARENHFFLGMDFTWLDRADDEDENEETMHKK